MEAAAEEEEEVPKYPLCCLRLVLEWIHLPVEAWATLRLPGTTTATDTLVERLTSGKYPHRDWCQKLQLRLVPVPMGGTEPAWGPMAQRPWDWEGQILREG